ncbi:MAG TPA: ATP-binding protein, partial [Acidimicrobiia bacterium]|nr:ATP-binding protein [Acidimicrobiia bacterium]
AVQAGVGIQVIDSDPAEAKRSLESISRASRSSLAEIRQVLGVLRDADGNAAYTPTPGLADLPKLVSEVSDAGLPVAMTVEGDTAQVPAGVGLAAYRVVQEALTNALRHARAGRATVRVDAADGLLQLEVTDDGRGVNGAASRGHGLVGMRERVAVYGGTIATGSAPEGGYRVAASLPYEAAPE